MSDTLIIAVAASLATFAALTALGGVSVVAAAYMHERTRRIGLEQALTTAQAELANYQRAGNKLYAENVLDMRARELKAADSVQVSIEHLLNAVRVLAPEMLKKGKK